MKKSDLLVEILNEAELLAEKSNGGITADVFLLLLLATVKEYNAETADISDKEDKLSANAKSELVEVKKIFDEYNVDYEKAILGLTDLYNNTLSNKQLERDFYLIHRRVVLEATLDDLKKYDCIMLLKAVLNDKTYGATKFILCPEDEAHEAEVAAAFDLEKMIDDFKMEKSVEREEKKPTTNTDGKSRLSTYVDRVKEVQKKLLSVVYGQDYAVNKFVSGYFQAEISSMLFKKRSAPRATYLFAGPPGVGKTFLAEQAAQVLGYDFCRFDMSEYADKEANMSFAGTNASYKASKPGNVTGYVAEHPKSVLLFDEIEKAHLVVIHLFLQMLDAGRLRDNYTEKEVNFTDTIIIFTTNVGRSLYEDPSITNLSAVPAQTIIKALSKDINPVTQSPLFPTAICSRFSSGNVIMFNHLGAHNLLKVVTREMHKTAKSFEKEVGMEIAISDDVANALVFAQGGKADARAIRGKTNNFVYEELYELFRLIDSEKKHVPISSIERISMEVELPEDERVKKLFRYTEKPEIIVFATGEVAQECVSKLGNKVITHAIDSLAKAKEILSKREISLVACDVTCKIAKTKKEALNIEDVVSEGRRFFDYCAEVSNVPLFLLTPDNRDISSEELLSFIQRGALGMLPRGKDFCRCVVKECEKAYQQRSVLELERSSMALKFGTEQTVSDDGKSAQITLYNLSLVRALEAGDYGSVLSDVSKPDTRFFTVIGAKDAKEELEYFVDFLKNPKEFMRRGVKAPKGILLYGPPGTGKTLLAKAMAGESDVTFIATEGNQFVKGIVGEGARAVHDVFATARKYAPSILFIDEIDAVAKTRSGSNDRADVLTAFLTEMDGFKNNTDKPVFVLAATNTEELLDPAIKRRFDRKILVDLPNREERKQFLELMTAKNKTIKLGKETIENAAVRSTGMSLAEMELVIELAQRDAIRAKSGAVDDKIFENAFESFSYGEAKKWDNETLISTARHEAGHALLCWLSGEKPSYVTIVSRGNFGGYMQSDDGESKMGYNKKELLGMVQTALAGRAAELEYYGEDRGLTTGASSDLRNATSRVEAMVCALGMDEVIGLAYIDRNQLVSSPYYSVVRERVNAILVEQMKITREIISANRGAIDALVEALLEKNHLKGNEIDEIFSRTIKR